MSITSPTDLRPEVQRRRTFAIISHPDAGKTTLTEKLLLYGGAVHMAGAVKARRAQQHAVSDWMELEKQRGISITSTVLSFEYQGYRLNLLDTPGHQDFSEDTYRTLLAADSAVMLDEIEKTLGLKTVAMNWPLGNGTTFRGVFDRHQGEVHWFERGEDRRGRAAVQKVQADDPMLRENCDEQTYQQFMDGIELLGAAGEEFNPEQFLTGQQSPVYFGSAVTNFGVQLFLDQFLTMAPLPGPRKTDTGPSNPEDRRFAGFVFKIQADMNPKHRDHVAFVRICSGRFERGMKVKNSRTGDTLRLSNPQQLFAQSREIVEEAYPGDVVGLVNAGDLALGDSLYDSGSVVRFEPIPQFPAEHFVRVTVADPSRRKQFRKALDQLTLEGAVQVFWLADSTTYDPILGAVGQLQFEVVEHRLKNDYGVDVHLEMLNYKLVRWLEAEPSKLKSLQLSRSTRLGQDSWEHPVVLLPGQWDLDYAREKNPGVEFHALSRIGA
jgi:peptide chain release factor 3